MTATALETVDSTARELLFTEARTSNSFSDQPVTDAELRGIWELTRYAPTMANSQPLRVLFVRTDEGKARLLPHLAEGNRAKAETAPVVAVLAYDADFHEQFPVTFPDRAEMFVQNFGGMPSEAREPISKYSAALASGVFFLAVRAHGLAAGPMGGFDAAGIDQEFFAGTPWRSHLVVNIGHPGVDPWFPRLPRVAVEDAVAWA
jgi:3-hydroxypropanoate dehydrogenase